ncbi:hypothetical protein [Bdellovibrio sp. HCB337]|uniref:hypothetical protein n=1 Tax=Bdellovibrio sp. HCB337 TaxID=3394358 RepID=UPI0039A558EC
MGPFILIDKSFLESLNPEEAMALNRHYCVFVSPILIREILGNLAKANFTPDKALTRVIGLAAKAQGSSSYVMHDARLMILNDLLSSSVKLLPGAPRFGATKVIRPNGKVGAIIPPTEEEQLLHRWAQGVFTDQDRRVAEMHNSELDNYDLPGSQRESQQLFPENMKVNSFEEIAASFDKRSRTDELEWRKIDGIAKFVPLSAEQTAILNAKWESEGRPDFRHFAEYANYCARIWTLYFIGVTADLVNTGKKHKTLIDILYFFYLPFAHIFCSADKFHRDHFRYFAREDQRFIWGPTLKEDLKQIVEYRRSLSPENLRKYDKELGSYPPFILNSVTLEMWKRFGPP